MPINAPMMHLTNAAAGMRLHAGIFATLLAGGMLAAPALAQPAPGPETHVAAAPASPVKARKVSQFHPANLVSSAKDYYQVVWGIDNLLVRRTASGNLIRFSYRVTDPTRAKVLGDEHATPYLYGQRSRALLHVPVMDKVGQLRQTGAGETGKEYWMVFSNKGDLVKSGDRVNVIIGNFHADGILIE